MIKITLNDREIFTEAGKTILEVARENGIEIPTLCHDPELQPYGSCWVCAVELKGARGFVTACGTRVNDGMDIHTDTEAVHKARKMALELLLSDHYADCVAPCTVACPNHVDIQAYVALIANGQFQEAVKTIKSTLPMPLSIGRVCPAFCEHECRRTLVEEPIAIRQLKRCAADFDLAGEWSWVPDRKPAKGQKVAIVGAGPSGLTCGYYLSNEGYDVTVFEASPQAGGWLRYGIPAYRLPKDILDREIELMCKNGMQILTNQALGKDISLNDLTRDYDAVYLALGAQKAVPMDVAGKDLQGVYLGVDFLKAFALGNTPKLGQKVAIIGGGNTAIDCARTTRRLGADVTIVYRRTRKEMPAEEYEVDAAEAEGVHFYMLTNPTEFLGENGGLKQVRFEKMALGEPDASGRRRPVPTGETFDEAFDTVIAAISQASDVDFLTQPENQPEGKEFPLTRKETAVVDEATMYAGVANLFAGGDFRRGPATAIEAVADGRRAAECIARYLADEMMAPLLDPFDSKKAPKLSQVSKAEYEQYEKQSRVVMPELGAAERATNFNEVETGFSLDAAKKEAARCLECGCQVNHTCDLRRYATEYQANATLFSGTANKHPLDHTHPFIQRDANRCIKCGRCVRTCSEIQGAGVLGYIYRGFSTIVAPEFGESLKFTSCESCGKCIAVCPVGALVEKNTTYKLNPDLGTVTVQNSGMNGVGSVIAVHTKQNRVTVIDTPAEEGFNGRNLSFDERFGWQIFDSADRLRAPQLQANTASWSDAATFLKGKLAAARTKKVYVGADCTNEEMLVLKEIAQTMGAELGTLSLRSDFTESLPAMPAKSFTELHQAEAIVLVGPVPHTLRTLARLEQRKGKKLIMIASEETKFSRFADHLFLTKEPYALLEGLKKNACHSEHEGCCCGRNGIVAIPLDLPNRTLFIYNRNQVCERTARNVWRLATAVCDFGPGSGVFATSDRANLRGLKRADIAPLEAAKADFVLLYGETPNDEQKKAFQGSGTVVFANTHPWMDADVVLPQASFLEIEGTTVADDGRLLRFRNPLGTELFPQWIELCHQLGLLPATKSTVAYWLGENLTREPNAPAQMPDLYELQEMLCCVEEPSPVPQPENLLRQERLAALKQLTKA